MENAIVNTRRLENLKSILGYVNYESCRNRGGPPVPFTLAMAIAQFVPGFDTKASGKVKSGAVPASIRVRASAKINLHLRVLPPMGNGYHGIESLFQAVDLRDRIVVRSLKKTGIRVRGAFDCPPGETTVHRAAESFIALTGVRSGVSIEVDKSIPIQAGLGGGSADAAAVIVAMDALFGSGLSRGTLSGLCAGIGSDVPFFLGGGAALVSGRGDSVEGIAGRTDFGILVVKPGFGSPTAAAFRALDESRALRGDEDPRACPPMKGPGGLESIYGKSPGEWSFFNSFQPVLDRVRPEYAKLREAIMRSGALGARLSGSGSSVFGIYASHESAAMAESHLASLLESAGIGVLTGTTLHVARPLASPLALD